MSSRQTQDAKRLLLLLWTTAPLAFVSRMKARVAPRNWTALARAQLQ